MVGGEKLVAQKKNYVWGKIEYKIRLFQKNRAVPVCYSTSGVRRNRSVLLSLSPTNVGTEYQ